MAADSGLVLGLCATAGLVGLNVVAVDAGKVPVLGVILDREEGPVRCVRRAVAVA